MDGRSRIADLVERGVVVSPTLIMDYQDSDAYDGILLQASQMLEAVGEQPQPEPDTNDDDILLQASQMFEAVEHEEKEVKLSRFGCAQSSSDLKAVKDSGIPLKQSKAQSGQLFRYFRRRCSNLASNTRQPSFFGYRDFWYVVQREVHPERRPQPIDLAQTIIANHYALGIE